MAATQRAWAWPQDAPEGWSCEVVFLVLAPITEQWDALAWFVPVDRDWRCGEVRVFPHEDQPAGVEDTLTGEITDLGTAEPPVLLDLDEPKPEPGPDLDHVDLMPGPWDLTTPEYAEEFQRRAAATTPPPPRAREPGPKVPGAYIGRSLNRGTPPGAWSGPERLAAMPALGQVYPELLRKVPLTAMRAEIDHEIARMFRVDPASRTRPEHAALQALRDDAVDQAENLAPVRLTDAQRLYLQAAAIFAGLDTPSRAAVRERLVTLAEQAERQAKQRGDRDAQREARREQYVKDGVVRDRLNSARKAGWLERPGQGRRGGDLTRRGEQLRERYLRQDNGFRSTEKGTR